MTNSQTPEMPETEEGVCAHIAEHWFIQGGEMQFGEIIGRNPDEIVASILRVVRASQPGVDGGAPGEPPPDMPANTDLSSALRSAEARGRVQGLREAAEDAVLPDVAAWLRRRADAIEQEQPK